MQHDKFWFKDAVIYELHVRSFCDSDADGIGDFRGLCSKLDYFEELGVTALWILPFYPSPLRDDGYDIADYYAVNPAYGTMDDFKEFLEGAHRRGLRVITELVINHTSDQHAWFQRSRRAPAGSPERDFYVWSDTPKRFEDARIIFKDFESSNWSWDPVAQAYYWHRFYSHQPDLNFDNPAVRQAVYEMADFWLGMGVDGLRLDAIPYLFEREGTSCENLPETHGYLKDLRAHIEEKYPDRMFLAEANQWPEDAVAYFGEGDECHMAFHFPLMPRLFMSLQMEDRFPIIDILEQTPDIPSSCQWAIFLRNHDELTLEMVTDEERDYMYRLYAEDSRARINLGIRRRLAPLLDNNRKKIELINALLFSLPGTPILYYGDEIGMGDNFYLGDRNGVRTPMQWNADRNAGFSRANPQQLFLPVVIDPEFHYEAVNVEVQMQNVSSLFWWTRRVLGIRKKFKAFSHGTLEFLRPSNAKVLAFLRRLGDETVLVVANLSRFSQAVSLDLSEFRGCRAEELFSGAPFLDISEAPVPFTVGPHGFYWLLIEPATASATAAVARDVPEISLPAQWSEELLETLRENILPDYLPSCRWFGQKQREIRTMHIAADIHDAEGSLHVLLLELSFSDGAPVSLVLPLFIGKEDESDLSGTPAMVAKFASGEVLWDALFVGSCRKKIWDLIAGNTKWGDRFANLAGIGQIEETSPSPSRMLSGEQSNTTINYGDQYLLKFLRRFEPGPHPDADVLRVLGERGFPHVPKYAGEIRCRTGGEEGVLGLLTSYVKNQGDGWTYVLDGISRFFERVLSVEVQPGVEGNFEELAGGIFPRRFQQLGQRTGELHLCLDGVTDRQDFAPEPFTPFYQRALYQTMRNLLRRTEAEVSRRIPFLDEELRAQAVEWVKTAPKILVAYSELFRRKIAATKIRIHGDYHLGQVLNTGDDFVILDFEGEPAKSLSERALKRSPLVDVAGMLRSFDYAVEASLLKQKPEDRARLRPWGQNWLDLARRSFLESYREAAKGGSFLPTNDEEFFFLLRLFLLDKSVYEVSYELNYRPDFLPIPIGAAARLLDLDPSQGLRKKGDS